MGTWGTSITNKQTSWSHKSQCVHNIMEVEEDPEGNILEGNTLEGNTLEGNILADNILEGNILEVQAGNILEADNSLEVQAGSLEVCRRTSTLTTRGQGLAFSAAAIIARLKEETMVTRRCKLFTRIKVARQRRHQQQ